MKISQILKEKRKEYQLTQEQLAEKIFVSTKTVSNWETEKTTPDIQNLILLSKLFDISLDNLLLEGSDIVETLNKDVKKGRSFLKLITIISISLIFIFSIILFIHYEQTKVYREQYRDYITDQPEPTYKNNIE